MNLLQNFHLAVIEYLYCGRRAVPLQKFTTRHSNRKLSIVMTLSTTFTQCAPGTTKFGKVTQNKGHFAVQGHSRSPILVPIESSYTTSYQDDSYESATEFPPCSSSSSSSSIARAPLNRCSAAPSKHNVGLNNIA